jgi:hypothetical protein
MTRHCPLDQDLAFDRYEHRSLEVRDVLINRIWEKYVVRTKPDPEHGPEFRSLMDRLAREIALEDKIPVLEPHHLLDLVRTNSEETVFGNHPLGTVSLWEYFEWDLGRFNFSPTISQYDAAAEDILRDQALDIVQRFYFEVIDPSTRFSWKQLVHEFPDPGKRQLERRVIAQIKHAELNARVQDAYKLYSGGFSKGARHSRYLAEGIYLSMHRESITGLESGNPVRHVLPTILMPTPKASNRSSSLPAPGIWARASYTIPPGFMPTANNSDTKHYASLIFRFPARKYSELDKLARRRSLSRSHIRNMFKNPPVEDSAEGATKQHDNKLTPCSNCGGRDHKPKPKECPHGCGHCGKKNHLAAQCPVKQSNRCKCKPFPRHVASKCQEQCSRRCGNPFPPRHNKHLNAMTCTFRCCMCGKKGHAGKQCSFKRCQCGQQHLTQSCRWKVECPAARCDRYLCGLHCAGCGKKRDRSVPFTGGRCRECLENSEPVRARVEET